MEQIFSVDNVGMLSISSQLKNIKKLILKKAKCGEFSLIHTKLHPSVHNDLVSLGFTIKIINDQKVEVSWHI